MHEEKTIKKNAVSCRRWINFLNGKGPVMRRFDSFIVKLNKLLNYTVELLVI